MSNQANPGDVAAQVNTRTRAQQLADRLERTQAELTATRAALTRVRDAVLTGEDVTATLRDVRAVLSENLRLTVADHQVFDLVRVEDVSNVSGTGAVATGIIFPSGKVALGWNSQIHTVTVFDSIDDVTRIHGHGGSTTIVYRSN